MNSKNNIQNSQYFEPYHWNLKRIEAFRYFKLTEIISGLVVHDITQTENLVIYDFGCGDGKNTYLLWSNLYDKLSKIIGIDNSKEAIEWAQHKTVLSNTENLIFIEGDIKILESLSRSEANTCKTFVLVMREVIEHLKIDEINKVLESAVNNFDSCWLIITTPSINSPVEKKHYRHYTPESLEQILRTNHFELVKTLGYGYRPQKIFKILKLIKKILNSIPLIWRVMIPLWRIVQPENAVTLVCLAKKSQTSKQ